jgi:hypothetical protein
MDEKKGADKGIDGRPYLTDRERETASQMRNPADAIGGFIGFIVPGPAWSAGARRCLSIA